MIAPIEDVKRLPPHEMQAGNNVRCQLELNVRQCVQVCHECLRPCIILRSSPKGNARTCAECFDSNRAVWEAASEADKADLECKRKPETLLQRAVRDYEQQERLRHFKLEVKRIMDEQSQQQQQQQQ